MAKVLLVDDDLTMVQTVSELLRRRARGVSLFQWQPLRSRADRAFAGRGHHRPLLDKTAGARPGGGAKSARAGRRQPW